MSKINVRSFSNENDDGAPDIVGITTFSATSYFVPTKGNTAQRPSDHVEVGSLRYNTDTKNLEYYRGNTIGWSQFELIDPDLGGGTGSNTGLGARAIFFGGYNAPSGRQNYINFLTISTLGDTQDFGDLNDHTGRPAATSSRTRAICCGGFQSPALVNILQFVTIPSIGNAVDFGDLTLARNQSGAFSSQIRGIVAGGNPETDTMDYHTIATTGNAVDFGNMTEARQSPRGAASSTRGLSMGGEIPSARSNVIDFVTIMSTGNATNFGDLNIKTRLAASCSNSTRALYAGGETQDSNALDTIEYILLQINHECDLHIPHQIQHDQQLNLQNL